MAHSDDAMYVDNENLMGIDLKYQTISMNGNSSLDNKYFCGNDNIKNDNNIFLNEEHIDSTHGYKFEYTDMPIEEKVILGQNDDQYLM